jgi:hypothetical protein
MKKVLYFAAVAAMFAACSSEELADQSIVKQEANGTPVNFSVYTPRTTRAGQAGDLTNANIGKTGFGVFAYYTNDGKYNEESTPNFMYNQKVTTENAIKYDGTLTAYDGDKWGVGTDLFWTYEPVKYWPNEYGDAAASDDIDRLTFFAYAPWTEFEPTTGMPTATDEVSQNKNITSISKNTAAGDPLVKYVVDTDPKTSVDLLWGVAAFEQEYGSEFNTGAKIEAGRPFIDCVKPKINDKIKFNLKHALAKVKFTIDYIADEVVNDVLTSEADHDTDKPATASKTINADETRIYVRWAQISGFAMKGALNLNNNEVKDPFKPNWKDIDGERELIFADAITFFDGRKDGKEATENGEAKNETPTGLNPTIIEDKGLFSTAGVKPYTGKCEESDLLFGGDAASNDGFFYVIPRDGGESVDFVICYDVETKDANLAGKLADNLTNGSLIQNIITKKAIFGDKIDFEPGKQYEIHIHIGMTSVKVEAVVTPWDPTPGISEVAVPENN